MSPGASRVTTSTLRQRDHLDAKKTADGYLTRRNRSSAANNVVVRKRANLTSTRTGVSWSPYCTPWSSDRPGFPGGESDQLVPSPLSQMLRHRLPNAEQAGPAQ